MITSTELMLGIGLSTMVWGQFMPGLNAVDTMELRTFRQHEALATTATLGLGVIVAVISRDLSAFNVSVLATIILGGLYEWKLGKNDLFSPLNP